MSEKTKLSPWRERMWHVIFEADTPSAKLFDVVLLIGISLSVFVVILDSVPAISERYSHTFFILECLFTALFTLEYVLRLICTRRPMRYVFSFFGIVDLLAILPTYLYFLGIQYLAVVRILRLLRVFRILKLGHFMSQARVITDSLRASRHKIFVFLYAVLMVVVVFGAIMYVVESGNPGFDSIPKSMYWAIVTLSTVGYGDIVPLTAVGKLIAGIIMVLGYGLIAVPTGIVTVEMAKADRRPAGRSPDDGSPDDGSPDEQGPARKCSSCDHGIHDADAAYCNRCGSLLPSA